MSIDNSIKLPQYLAALAASGGALSAGTIIGWTSPIIFHLKVYKEKIYDFDISMEQFSWFTLTTILSAALGSIPTGILINYIGRKLTMICMTIPFTIGWFLLLFAQNVEMIFIGHFILGIAGGAFCIITPIYIGEIAQKEIRGSLGTYYQFMLTLGALFVHFLGIFLNLIALTIVCALIPLVFLPFLYLIPETPLHLVTKVRPEQAKKSILWLRGKNYDPNTELASLKLEYREAKANPSTPWRALKRRDTLMGLFIILGLMFFQLMSGSYAITQFSAYILKSYNVGINVETATVIIILMQLVSTLCSVYLVDKIGRRLLLLISEIIMTICTLFFALYFYLMNDGADVYNFGWIPVTAICFFNVVFSFGFGPVPWIMIGELFAPDIKGLAVAFTCLFYWILTFGVIKVFHILIPLVNLIETFFVYSFITFLGIFFVYFFVPETKEKSLSDIQKILSN